MLSETNKLIYDLNLLSKYNISSMFCLKLKESWMENNSLYLVTEFCKFGDLLNYLETLEKYNFNFTEAFYWDLIFEMTQVNNLLILGS